MTDRKGDPTKQPPNCKPKLFTRNPCQNMKERVLTDMNGETYRCDVCGESFYLDYDEMR